MDRQFEPEAPNQVWTADITYIPTREGWLYLAAVEDLYSRRIVGWSMGERIDSRLVVDALEMAVARRLPGAGLVAHSDRGSQYASEHYRGLLAGHGITCSMSRRANCWDNAPMESFFATLKKELVHDEDYATREEARASLFEYIEVFYNRVRRHSSLGYRSPVEYETSRITVNPALAIRGEVQMSWCLRPRWARRTIWRRSRSLRSVAWRKACSRRRASASLSWMRITAVGWRRLEEGGSPPPSTNRTASAGL